eukprot:scaffold1439_cov179-Ochromonas_danica.AAC.4
MGKKWQGNKGKRGGGGESNKGGHDIPSCKGYPILMGTCDAAKERESSRELVNLLNDLIEELYPITSNPSLLVESTASKSIEEMMRAEIEEVKEQKHTGTQNVVSINTSVKGIVLIKILRKECCPVRLVKHIFNKVKEEKQPLCRYVVRIIPLQKVCYPEVEEILPTFLELQRSALSLSTSVVVDDQQPQEKKEESPEKIEGEDEEAAKKRRIDESGNSVSVLTPERIPYCIAFKARNHNVLKKDEVHRLIQGAMAAYGYGDFRNPKVMMLVEVLKSICGLAWIEGYGDLSDLNIRKHQQIHVHGENKSLQSDVQQPVEEQSEDVDSD